MAKPKLIQQVFEARYERGYRFLDRCGEVMLILEEMLPTLSGHIWMQDQIAPTGARLKCPELDVQIVFDTYRLVVDQNPADIQTDFIGIAGSVYATIVARFDLRQLVRAGCRRMFLLPSDSVEEAEELSVKHAPFHNWPAPTEDGMRTVATEAVSVVESEDGSGYRFSTKPISRVESPLQADERLRSPPRLQDAGQRRVLIEQLKRQSQREKTPVAGLLIDIDQYVVRPTKFDAGRFLSDAILGADRLLSHYPRG